MKFNGFKCVILAISLFMIAGCGNSDSPSESVVISDEIIDGHQTVRLKIRPSSSGRPWKMSYGKALEALLSDPFFSEMYDAEIEKEDLALVDCLNFNELNYSSKKIFYIAFLAAIAEAESDFEAEQKTYNRADNTMNIGMLQIDRASANRHGADYFDRYFNEEDLKKPELNLMIGALILNNQITGRVATNRLFPDRTYYWQVLSGSKKRVLANLRLNIKPTGICRSWPNLMALAHIN